MTESYLNDLSLEDLNTMVSMIVGLKQAGYLMREQGFDPRFSLYPGHQVLMRLDYVMPLAGVGMAHINVPSKTEIKLPVIDDDLLVPAPTDTVTEYRGSDDGREGKTFVADPAPDTAPETEAMLNEVFRAVGMGKADAAPVEAPEPIALTGADVEAAVAGAAVAVLGHDPAPAPVAERGLHRPAPAAPWTDEEDQRLVRLIASGIVEDGLTKGAALGHAATLLGRTSAACELRQRGLKDALNAALAALRDPPSVPAVAPPETSPAGADSAGSGSTAPRAPEPEPAPAPRAPIAATLSEIEQHLLDMPRKGGWTAERDFALLTGVENSWGVPEIAADMSLSGREVTERYNLLTKFDAQKKTRAYRVTALRMALQPWVSSAAAD